MQLGDILTKTRSLVKSWGWVALALLLTSWSAYNVGLLLASTGTKPLQEAVTIKPVTVAPQTIRRTDTRVVASKASTSKKYHYSHCPGAAKTKEANKVWFATAQLAQSAGYTLAANCR